MTKFISEESWSVMKFNNMFGYVVPMNVSGEKKKSMMKFSNPGGCATCKWGVREGKRKNMMKNILIIKKLNKPTFMDSPFAYICALVPKSECLFE